MATVSRSTSNILCALGFSMAGGGLTRNAAVGQSSAPAAHNSSFQHRGWV